MYFRRYSRPRKFSRRPRRVIRRRTKVSRKIKTYVKKAIHRNIENKDRVKYAANITLNSLSYSTQSIGLLPDCAQNTGASGRIGNQIRLVKGSIKGHINLKPYDATTNPSPPPLWVRLLLVKDLKNAFQSAFLNSTAIGKIFRAGDTALAQQFNMLDMSLPVNTDSFRVFAQKTFRLGVTSTSATTPVSSGSYFDNSHMSVPFWFNYGKYCKKQLKFNDNIADYFPENDNMYLVIMAVNADGTSNIYQPVEYHYVNTALYEDA